MAKNVSARSSWYAPLRASCTGVQSLMLRCFPRSLPRLTCSCPVVEELPGHEIYGEYAKDQQHLQEESTDQGKRQPGDDGAGGFDHVVAGDELRSPEHAVRDQQRRVASSETKAASMKALPKRNQRLRSWYLRLLRHRLTAKRFAKSAPQYTFQLVTVYSSGTPLRTSRHMARASARCPIRMRQASTSTFRPTPSRKRKTKYFSFSMAAGPYAATSVFAAGLNQPVTARSTFSYRPATLAWKSSTVLLML